ncbi:alpha/beta hydrolase [Calothrix sp. UHCC 0171]|uniref:alpha/beta hydrolase n=1 Tax=Calothrix sp. UHCC 0171 TaxID=3110245 RepID=UPI002B21F00C|nr:alpha/beta hydrolase [Calothrix sp. UHCC 0171]MEA5571282.1 alpha/beta hydrolase [Calothrix sp. UHCC 0171]
MLPKVLQNSHFLVFTIFTSVLLNTNHVFAAEKVVLKYRVFRESLSVTELSDFADNGKLSIPMRVGFKLAQQDPNKVRRYLTEPVKVNAIILDRVLNSPVGNIVLDQMSEVIHTPSRKADRQAMRSALVLSANQDNDIKLIEVIKNYPGAEVEVDGDRLEKAFHQLRRLQGSLKNIFGF